MTAVLCPMCNHALPPGDPGRRGVLINRKAALGAKLAALKTSLAHAPTAALRADLLIHIDQVKAQIAAVGEQLEKDTKEKDKC